MAKRVALGRGLGSLIEVDPIPTGGSSSINEIEIDKIFPNPEQPRRDFDPESLAELALSIKQLGIIQPITLRQQPDGGYTIVAGERRFRAAQQVGLKTIPAYIRTLHDNEMMEMALIENIQRDDLNPIEIALAYQNILKTQELTQVQLSEKIGKKRATITNYIRLLKLPAEIQMSIKNRQTDMGHARALVAIEDYQDQLHLYEVIKQKELSVRKTEEVVRLMNSGKTLQEALEQLKISSSEKNSPRTSSSLSTQEFEVLKKHLSTFFNSPVQLTCNDKGKGKISIPFRTSEELEQLIELFDRMRRATKNQ